MNSRVELANALRALAMDAVQKANSGHPGMPMGMADIAEVLWNHHLRHNPANPGWADRDRFVLSNGHGSMLLYGLLHLTGYDLSIDDIKQFRQLHSRTPGHPEYGCAPGVETTTGPLGQGLANAVGMAIAERALAAEFNRDGFDVIDHHTYVFVGDGCLMEGISHEACALAGTLGLSKLIAIYDDNGISIDSEKGQIKQWYTDDVKRRFEAYGWQVIPNVDGHDRRGGRRGDPQGKARKNEADADLRENDDRQGFAQKAEHRCGPWRGVGRKGNRGNARGDRLAVRAVRNPAGSVRRLGCAQTRRGRRNAAGSDIMAGYEKQYPAEAAELKRRMARALPDHWKAHCEAVLAQVNQKAETIATRKASQNAIEALAPALPELIGGSADLASSNLTLWSGSKAIGRERWRQLYFLRRARIRHGGDRATALRCTAD